MKIDESCLQRAKELHRRYPVVDAHLDLPGEVLLRHRAGEHDFLDERYGLHFQEACVDLVVASIFVETANLGNAWQNVLDQMEALKKELHSSKLMKLITTQKELTACQREHKTAILLYLEGLDCIGRDPESLTILYAMGVRGASLTWSRQNALATGCCSAAKHIQTPGEITGTGKRVIHKLEELSMFLDISHLNDQGYAELQSCAARPYIATHSNSRAVYNSYRNLTDDQMKQLAGQGGIMGLNACKYITGSRSDNHLEMLCRHVEYEVKLLGEKHVGFGLDLCDSYDRANNYLKGRPFGEPDDCLKNHGELLLVTAALLQRGMSEEQVIPILGENFLQYFQSLLQVE